MIAKTLSSLEIQNRLNNVTSNFPLEACWTCECFLGYLAQLQVDSDGTNHELIRSYKPDRRGIHSCLGCDPCPPGDHLAQYLREQWDEI